ncbi:MAG: hypothetical protein IT349_21810 [Candidatus Eisenbacteria bacterium]|nr:hypothetical protein [Candidatus Eisenbacteria bacterium]MCC7144747.1 hypothetical protein [Candidatus Eisenbacteria bacterium]
MTTVIAINLVFDPVLVLAADVSVRATPDARVDAFGKVVGWTRPKGPVADGRWTMATPHDFDADRRKFLEGADRIRVFASGDSVGQRPMELWRSDGGWWTASGDSLVIESGRAGITRSLQRLEVEDGSYLLLGALAGLLLTVGAGVGYADLKREEVRGEQALGYGLVFIFFALPIGTLAGAMVGSSIRNWETVVE